MTETDFARARQNMVNAQLEPNAMHNEDLLEAYRTLPREAFVEDALRPHAYLDEDLPLQGGQGSKSWLLEPMVEGRMIQEALRGPAAAALVLGAANLPAAAMLARFVPVVTVIEPDAALAARATARLAAQAVAHISVGHVLVEHAAHLGEGHAARAPYDIILVPGAVSAIPPALVDQLALDGRLVCVLRETPREQGRILVVRRQGPALADTRVIADVATPYLPGFEPAPEFVF